MHSFVHGCSEVGNLNKFGMRMCRFGMEHFHGERGTADWLLVAVRALVLVSEIRAAVIHVNSASSETWLARVPW